MSLHIQDFLRANGSAPLALPPYSLNIKQHPEFPNLYQFTYDQIESKRDDPLVREARGLILDADDGWNVVAYPFRRFFNEGEGPADHIDWSTARVQEKVDGTLIIMYHYANRWRIATKGSPDASGSVGDHNWIEDGKDVPMTFERLFWHSIEYWFKGLSHTGQFNGDRTYMWELTSPWNRVVCDYTVLGPMGEMVDGNGTVIFMDDLEDKTGYAGDGSRVTLIGVRDNRTLQEIPVDDYRDDVHYVVKEFPLASLTDVVEAAKALNPIRQEGFVVVDARFNRIKIKSPAYVAIHHLRDGSPERRLMDLIKAGEENEVMAYSLLDEFPMEKKMFEDFRAKIEWLCLQTETAYASIENVQTQKDFALEALKTPYHAAMFALRKGQVKSARDFYLKLPTDKLLDLVRKVSL